MLHSRRLPRIAAAALVVLALLAMRLAAPDSVGAVGVAQISAGENFTCAVTVQQSVICWGSNILGRTSVPPGLLATQVAAGALHACALKSSGEVVCWGSNTDNQRNVPSDLRATQIRAYLGRDVVPISSVKLLEVGDGAANGDG